MATTPRPVIDSVVRSVCGREVERLVRLIGGGLHETYRVEVRNDVPVVVRIARQPVPWFTDEDAMWRKTGIRAARPSLLLTGDALLGFESDNGIVADLGVTELGDAEAVFDVLEASEASEDDG